MPEFAKRRAAADPGAAALVDPRRTLTWGQVDETLNRCAHAILAHDFGPRRRVAVFAENAAETP